MIFSLSFRGVQFVVTAMTGHTSRHRPDPCFWIGVFVAYVQTDDTRVQFLHNVAHDLRLVVVSWKAGEAAETELGEFMKDFNTPCVREHLAVCNDFSIRHSAHFNGDENDDDTLLTGEELPNSACR